MKKTIFSFRNRNSKKRVFEKMSIKADVRELELIRQELVQLRKRIKLLKDKEAKVEERIQTYILNNDLPGVKDKETGTAIIFEEKNARAPKKVKEKDTDSTEVLARYGVANPEKVLQEILEARKGEAILKQKLKIQKVKSKHENT